MREVLRGAWGFDGAVDSDWGAMSSSVASVRAGLDLCMPGPRGDHARALVEAVRSGELEEDCVTGAASHIEWLAHRVKACRAKGSVDGASESSLSDEEFYRAHADLAREAAAQSAVLLKNDGVLPLNPDAKVAVIGAFARMPRYQGSGSSRINPKIIDNIWYRLEQRGVAAEYADGYDPTTGDADERQLLEAETLAARSDVAVIDNIWYRLEQRGVAAEYADGYDPTTGDADERQLLEAETLAARSDVAVVVAGLPARYESEGFDRKLMVMPRGMRELIDRVCDANPRTVVVLQGGAPMDMPWRDNPAAILLMYLSGCQGGGAAVDVLVSDVIIDNIWYRLEQRGVAAEYADGYDPTTGDADERQLLEAETLAARSDVAGVVAGPPARYESEGFDRKLMVSRFSSDRARRDISQHG